MISAHGSIFELPHDWPPITFPSARWALSLGARTRRLPSKPAASKLEQVEYRVSFEGGFPLGIQTEWPLGVLGVHDSFI